MKVCKRFEERITDYVDGVLSGSQKTEADRHFQECRDCLDALNEAKTARRYLRSLPNHKTSADFVTVLRTRISMERSLGRRGLLSRPIRIPMYAATGVALALAAFFVSTSLRTSFGTKNTEAPAIVAPSFSNAQDVSRNTRAGRQLPQKVNFPMDWVNVANGGTSINSDELSRFSDARIDSSRGVNAKQVQHVEF